jgi:hypothetical protein
MGYVEQKGCGKGDHQLYLHPRGLVWGFDPRGYVKPPYVRELVRLVQTRGLVEDEETNEKHDKD